MQILITHEAFANFAGTESYMLTVAEQLQRTGHEAAIYAPNLGPMADFARTRGVKVLDRHELPDSCELILPQDAATCLEMAARYAEAKVIYVAHSAVHMLQTPPQIPGAYDALVVLNDRMLAWAGGLAHAERVVRLRQPVDMNRFRLSHPHQTGPPRVLVLSSYPFGSRVDQLTAACRRVGVQLRWLTQITATPEREIATADAVIGLGRSALDAMAASRAVLVLGTVGADGWVTPESYPRLEADGFSGRSSDTMLDPDAVAEQLAAWNPVMGNVNRDLVARHHDVRDHARELIALAGELVDRPAVRIRGPESEMARLVRLEWQRTSDLVTARFENHQLASERELQEHEAQVLRAQIAGLRGDLERTVETLEQVFASRRWRVGVALTRPLDRLRVALRRGARLVADRQD